MREYVFTIPAVPVAQPRARARAQGKHVRIYNPTTIKKADGTRKPHPIAAFKATARLVAQQIYVDAPPLIGPVEVNACFIFPRPTKHIWKTKPMPRYPHAVKPDRDNLDKALLDALTGTVWRDDAQVYKGLIEKYYAAGDEQPRVIVRIIADE